MDGAAFTLFDTALGRCAIVWRGGLVVGAALPETSDEKLRMMIGRRFPHAEERAADAFAAVAVRAVQNLLSNGVSDCEQLPCDLSGTAPFERSVLEFTRSIPCGHTRTYGEIASALGSPGAARAVGMALARNPVPIIIPCHRVLAASGAAGGFSAPGGVSTKMRLLEIEGAGRMSGGLFANLPLAVKT